MANKIGILLLWLMFAAWAYVFLIYLFGMVWFSREKGKKTLYNRPLIITNLAIFLLNTVGQVFTVVLFLSFGQSLLSTSSPTVATTTQNNQYTILFVLNLVIMILQLLLFLFFSNNIAIKFGEQKLLIVGMAVLYSAIVSLQKNKKGCVILEYVYKKENKQIWTEKLKFYYFFNTTKFLYQHGHDFFDPERNLAFFKIDQVLKPTKKAKPSSPSVAKENAKPSLPTAKKTKTKSA